MIKSHKEEDADACVGRDCWQPNECGLKYMAIGSAVENGFAKAAMLFFQRVDGTWKVYQSEGIICPAPGEPTAGQ